MSSTSIMKVDALCVRVAGEQKAGGERHLTFVPSHTDKNGKLIGDRVSFKVYSNSHRGNGGEGRSSIFRVTVWNGLALACARALSVGKELCIIGRLESYLGKAYDQQGTLVVLPTGQPLMIQKTGIVVDDLIFGNDSAKTIASEIQMGMRPVGWNIEGTPDWQCWSQIMEARNKAIYVPGAVEFGYAKVVMPEGGTLVTRGADGKPVRVGDGMTGYVAAQATPAIAPAYQAPVQTAVMHVANQPFVQAGAAPRLF